MQKNERKYIKSFARESDCEDYINLLIKKDDLEELPTNDHGYIPITLKRVDEDIYNNKFIIYLNTRLL
jgi:hypothetical protein